MFELKKIIGGLLMPLPITLILIFLLLLFISKKNSKSYYLCVLSVVALWGISTPHFADYTITPKEHTQALFSQADHKQIDFIVVLGGGSSLNADLHANLQLSNSSLVRLVEGLRLANIYPNAKLILSGAGNKGFPSTSHLLSRTAQSLGLSAERIQLNPDARDTVSEAKLLAPTLVDNKVILVTSASHMKRAQDLFSAQGVDTIPAPVEFYNYSSTPAIKRYIASSSVLLSVNRYVHEWLGIQWIKLRRALDSGSV
ncbi:YdcF family protein [Pseudoalteromonas luteoviolacea]|uniref:YdcF family protein n=1 Tax=Pseudoalteromonas luteoviolacea TaxID=43657 RepID=UPI001B37DD11|nr:ElyC/SanA/YdcF family protein [Pseudoalteromonas luteoviolacea]MBQ4814306.1 YdcF family protein [Pseudoalteromonas luteoviolacea]